MFNEYRFSVEEDEKVLDVDGGDVLRKHVSVVTATDMCPENCLKC